MKKIYLLAFGALMGMNVMADNKVTIFVNGDVWADGKELTGMTFTDDKVSLAVIGESELTEDIVNVRLHFDYEPSTGIQGVGCEQLASKDTKVYNLNGQWVGNSTEGLVKGVYIVDGKKVMIK